MNLDKIKNFLKSCNITAVILWLLVIIGVVIRFKAYSFNPSFWLDECMLGVNINEIGSNYLKYFRPLALQQCAPPLFLITCRLILDISHQAGHLYNQDWVLRLFPFLCSIVSLPLFAILLTKISTNKYFIWLSMAMLAFNRTAIYYSQEFKQYSCEMMFSLILLLIFCSIDLKKISIKKLGSYVFVFALSMWFSSSAILILFVGYLLLLYEILKNKIYDKLKISILLIPLIGNMIAYYFLYFKAVNSRLHDYMVNYWTNIQPSFFTFSNFGDLFVSKMQDCIHFPYPKLLILFLIISLIIFLANREINYKIRFLVPCLITFILVASFASIYPFEQRLILFLLPIFIIVYAQFAFLLKENWISTIALVLTFIVLTSSIFAISRNKLANRSWANRYYRQCAQFIIDNKIPPKKAIIITKEQLNYYLHSHFSIKNILFDDHIWHDFEKSKLPNFISKLPNDDYWFFLPDYTSISDYAVKVKSYFENSNAIEIIQKIEDENNEYIFIVHFRKK